MLMLLAGLAGCPIEAQAGSLESALLDACGQGDLSAVESLVERGADVNAESEVMLVP